jgi:hypothetical protein
LGLSRVGRTPAVAFGNGEITPRCVGIGDGVVLSRKTLLSDIVRGSHVNVRVHVCAFETVRNFLAVQ